MNTSTFSIRIDSQLKSAVEACLDEMGMNMSTAINIYLRQIVRQQAIPFAITANVPSKATIEAIKEGERIAHDPKVQGYNDIDSLFKALNS